MPCRDGEPGALCDILKLGKLLPNSVQKYAAKFILNQLRRMHCRKGQHMHMWGICCQKQVSQAGISNYIPHFTMGCNTLIPAWDTCFWQQSPHIWRLVVWLLCSDQSYFDGGGHFTTQEISRNTYQFHPYNITIIRKVHLKSTSKINIF